MKTVVDALRDYLVDEGLVRRPDHPGAGARPWLPVAWRHPDNGAVGPGDAAQQKKPAAAQDDGLVVSLMYAPGIPPRPGEEERRTDGVDVVLRGNAMQPMADLEAEIRVRLLGDPPDPGGRADWTMAGLYVIQSSQWRPFQPLAAGNGVFTFTVGYVFDVRAI